MASTFQDIGNEGSITGVNDSTSSAEKIITPKKGTNIISLMISYWWLVFLLAIGGVSLYSMVTTNPQVINPTDNDISIVIDGTSYDIPSNDYIEASLSHGEHSVSMEGKEMGKFTFGWFDEDSIINPTLSEFVMVEVLYGDKQYSDTLSNNTITLSGQVYSGPYMIIPGALYVKKNWDYGVYEESPSSVSIKSDYAIKKELFTVEGFIDSYYSDRELQEQEEKPNNIGELGGSGTQK